MDSIIDIRITYPEANSILKFYGGENTRKAGKRKEEKIFTALLREEETFHSFRDNYRRTDRQRSTEVRSKTSHMPSGKMEESIFPGNGLPTRKANHSDPQRDITSDSRHQNPFLLKGLLRGRGGNPPIRSEERILKPISTLK